MTKAQKISELIMIQVAATGSIKAGFDAVMGEGAYDKLAHEVYYQLRANNK
jgi:hypothetical protein